METHTQTEGDIEREIYRETDRHTHSMIVRQRVTPTERQGTHAQTGGGGKYRERMAHSMMQRNTKTERQGGTYTERETNT